MEGKEAIINKIKEDASKKASSIIDNASFEGKLLIKDAEKWVEDYLSTQNELLIKQKKEIIERKLTVADLDVRKLFLQKKQDLINEILDRVYEELTKLDKKDYLNFVEKMIKDFADEGDTVYLSKDKVLNRNDIESLAVFKSKKLSISDKEGDFVGGVYLESDISDKDLSFKSVVESKKEDLISSIAEKLFN